jgi:hypothetical protein
LGSSFVRGWKLPPTPVPCWESTASFPQAPRHPSLPSPKYPLHPTDTTLVAHI